MSENNQNYIQYYIPFSDPPVSGSMNRQFLKEPIISETAKPASEELTKSSNKRSVKRPFIKDLSISETTGIHIEKPIKQTLPPDILSLISLIKTRRDIKYIPSKCRESEEPSQPTAKNRKNRIRRKLTYSTLPSLEKPKSPIGVYVPFKHKYLTKSSIRILNIDTMLLKDQK